MAGTPEYMSPEHARGEGVDIRTDLYSLGVTIFEMLTGQVPFKAKSAINVLRMHCEEEIPDILEEREDIPPNVAVVIRMALAKNRDERFIDATEMASAMAKVQRHNRASGHSRAHRCLHAESRREWWTAP
ncbi:MAG: protein kinase [Planctomycetota bacterium]|nr:protein kinase [Planctomycetota bacterium]